MKQGISWFGLCVMVACLSQGCAASQQSQAGVKQAVYDFARHAEKRDIAQMQQLLHLQGHQYAMIKGRLAKIPHPTYIEMLRGKKIGGTEMKVTLHHVDIRENRATVQATLQASAFRLECAMSLLQEQGRWKIISNLVRFVKS